MTGASVRVARVAVQPAGLREPDAAFYIGVGQTKFRQWVGDGRMPRPFRVDGVVLWDRIELDLAFERLKNADEDFSDLDRRLGL